MAFTLIAFSESIDAGGIYANIAAVKDQTLKTAGDYIYVPIQNLVIGVLAMIGASGSVARINSPSLRRTNPYYVNPPVLGIVPSEGRDDVYFPQNPLVLTTNEPVETNIIADPAAAEQVTTLLWIADQPPQPVSGAVYTVRATITLAQLAGAWAFSELTFLDELPTGDYALVGARCVAAGGVGFRFVPIGYSERPGGVVAQTVGNRDPYGQRMGSLGEWFSFNTVQPPGVEMISSVAVGSATYNIYLDVIAK